MKSLRKVISLLLAVVLLAATGVGAFAVSANAANENWITSWGTSLVNGSVSVAGLALQDLIPAGATLRTVLTVTTGGSQLRFVFSNQYGSADVVIGEASVAKTGTGVIGVQDGTQTPITFRGQPRVTIPAGQKVTSDAISFRTQPLESISISLYFENLTYMTSVGLSNGRTFMRRLPLSSDSQVNAVALTGASEVNIGSGAIVYHTIPFLERIDTASSSSSAAAAVFIGDSTLVNDTYLYYAKRIVSAGVKNISVVNEAVIGNKLLSNGSGIIGNLYGQALIDRFERDVLNIKGVKYCFVKIGLNDVLHQFSKTLSAATPKYTPEDIIAGYRTLINLCHSHGIKIYFFTKSPWMGYERNFLGSGVDVTWTQQEQDMCDALTEWVLTNKEADGFIDCAPLADPHEPRQLCPSFTPDGAHLTDLGAIALADLIPLEYVGVKSSKGKTAAELAGKDPYAEKRQIEADMAAGKYDTTAPATEIPTTQPEEPTTVPEVPTTLPEVPTTLPQPYTTQPSMPAVESYTVYTVDPNQQTELTDPYVVPSEQYTYTVPAATTPNQEVSYNVTNDGVGEKSSVGSGATVGFLMIFVLAMVIAVAVVVLTMMKKKENF